jgi:flagellar basal body rod protein FlgG
MRTRLEELDRLAADLANASTAGYKTQRSANVASDRDSFAAELDSAVDVVLGGTKIDFSPGLIANTGRDMDVAIDGNGFFVVQTERGERYTRAGGFRKNADGLLTTMEGEPVLGESGEIKLPNGPVSIAEDGTVRSGTAVLGRVQIVEFGSEKDLIRESGSRFRALPGSAPPVAVDTKLVGGALEQSNVSVVEKMAKLTEVTRSFEALNKGVTTLMTELDARAIAELAKR